MALDKSVAERRRFARLLGLADDHGSGLPVGLSADDETDVVEASAGDRPSTQRR